MSASPPREEEADRAGNRQTIVLIANPRAGHGRGARITGKAVTRLRAAGLAPEIHETTAPGHGTALAARARDADLVIALGGDGTLHEVLNGLFVEEPRGPAQGSHPATGPRGGTAVARPSRQDDPVVPSPRAALAVLPAGTGNSFLRDFGITNFEQALQRLLLGSERQVDVGRFTCAMPEGARTGVFVSLIGVGFVADVCAVVQRKYKGMGTAGYVWGALATLAALRSWPVRLTLDGTTEQQSLTMATLCNSRYTGGAMLVAPSAAIDDGRFDLITAGPISRADLAAILPRVFRGAHLRHPAFAARRAATVSLDADDPLPLMFDGEPYGQTPLEVTMLPGALRLRV